MRTIWLICASILPLLCLAACEPAREPQSSQGTPAGQTSASGTSPATPTGPRTFTGTESHSSLGRDQTVQRQVEVTVEYLSDEDVTFTIPQGPGAPANYKPVTQTRLLRQGTDWAWSNDTGGSGRADVSLNTNIMNFEATLQLEESRTIKMKWHEAPDGTAVLDMEYRLKSGAVGIHSSFTLKRR